MFSALTAISTVLGALAGLIPSILQFFTMKASNAHQLELERLRMQAAKEGVALQVDLANVQADIRQYDRIYDFANAPSGVRFVDALAVFVRPYITLVMFHVWVLIEIGLFVAAVMGGLTLDQVVGIIWDEPTKAIFGSIIGFWFGNRASMRGSRMMSATAEVAQNSSPVATSSGSSLKVTAHTLTGPKAMVRPGEGGVG